MGVSCRADSKVEAMADRIEHRPPATSPSVSKSASTGLILRLKDRDQEAWRRLLVLYGPLVFSWCRRSEIPAQDSADVVQDVFQAVHRGIASFRYTRPADTFRGWLRTIARNKIHDYFRKRAGEPLAMGGTGAQQWLAGVAADEETEELPLNPPSELVHRGLDLIRSEFEDGTWQAFLLTTVERLSASEAAQRLGMTSGAVRQAKYRVLRRLRQELGDVE